MTEHAEIANATWQRRTARVIAITLVTIRLIETLYSMGSKTILVPLAMHAGGNLIALGFQIAAWYFY